VGARVPDTRMQWGAEHARRVPADLHVPGSLRSHSYSGHASDPKTGFLIQDEPAGVRTAVGAPGGARLSPDGPSRLSSVLATITAPRWPAGAWWRGFAPVMPFAQPLHAYGRG